MELAVFGANGPTGRLVVRRALDEGHRVTAVTRKPDQYPITSPDLAVVAADVTDPDAVERAVQDSQAVISTYGVPYRRGEITVYSDGITNIVRAMALHDVERLVCVSSTTVATEDQPGEPLYWRRGVIPLLRNVLGRTLYDDMTRMEAIVAGTGLDWTIVRPAGLFDTATATPTGDYEVATHRLPGRVTSRTDLADLLVREAVATQHSRSTVEVISRSGVPTFGTFLREAFGVGA